MRRTYPCHKYPLKPHFYIEKLGFAGVYLFFLFLLQSIDCEYSLEPPRRAKIRKISKIFIFYNFKKLCIMHGRVFFGNASQCFCSLFMSRVMIKPTFCICENKGADQLRSNSEADQRLCFATRIVQFLFYLNRNVPVSGNLLCFYSSVYVEPVRRPHCWFSHDAAHLYNIWWV